MYIYELHYPFCFVFDFHIYFYNSGGVKKKKTDGAICK